MEKIYQKFDNKRKSEEAKEADLKDIEELKELELKIKPGKK